MNEQKTNKMASTPMKIRYGNCNFKFNFCF